MAPACAAWARRSSGITAWNTGAATWPLALKSLVRGGRLVTCGATTGDQPGADLRRLFVRQLAILYAVSALGITAIALAVIYAITRSAPNALALAVLAGLWLSLWLAPGIASFTTWRQLHSAELNRDR